MIKHEPSKHHEVKHEAKHPEHAHKNVPVSDNEPKPVKITEPFKPVETYKFNEDAFKAKLAELIKSRDKHAGQQETNSYVWYRDNVQMKDIAFKNGDRSQTLFDSLMKVSPFVPPKE